MPSRKRPSQFGSAREAKEFLVSRIVDEAQREGVPLSEVERKELYHSETDWPLPDMASVDRDFDNERDQDEYERKIKKLVRNARMIIRKIDPQESQAWSDAIRVLNEEDHYLSVMVGSVESPRNRIIDLFRGVCVGLAIVILLVSAMWFLNSHFPNLNKRGVSGKREGGAFVAWCCAVAFIVLYSLARLLFGKEKTDAALRRALEPPVDLLMRVLRWGGLGEK